MSSTKTVFVTIMNLFAIKYLIVWAIFIWLERPIIGVDAVRSGHALNHELLCTLFSNSDTWSISELSAAVVPGTGNLLADMTH